MIQRVLNETRAIDNELVAKIKDKSNLLRTLEDRSFSSLFKLYKKDTGNKTVDVDEFIDWFNANDSIGNFIFFYKDDESLTAPVVAQLGMQDPKFVKAFNIVQGKDPDKHYVNWFAFWKELNTYRDKEAWINNLSEMEEIYPNVDTYKKPESVKRYDVVHVHKDADGNEIETSEASLSNKDRAQTLVDRNNAECKSDGVYPQEYYKLVEYEDVDESLVEQAETTDEITDKVDLSSDEIVNPVVNEVTPETALNPVTNQLNALVSEYWNLSDQVTAMKATLDYYDTEKPLFEVEDCRKILQQVSDDTLIAIGMLNKCMELIDNNLNTLVLSGQEKAEEIVK